MKHMQKFNPDCIISVCILTKQLSHSYGVVLEGVDPKNKDKLTELVCFSSYISKTERVEAELKSIKLALEQAQRLKREKIHLRVDPDFRVSLLENARSTSLDEKLKLIHKDVQRILEEFRFKQIEIVSRDKMPKALSWAEKGLQK